MSDMSLQDVVPGTGDRPPRRQRRAAEKRRKRRRRRTLFILFISLVVVGGAIGGAYAGLKPMIASLTAPKDWTGTGTGSIEVQVPNGASGAQIGTVLAKAGVVKTAKAFADAAGNDPRSQGIQPGTYRLRLHMSAASALGLLLEPASRLTVKVMIPEGLRLSQILDSLAKQTKIPRAQFAAALKQPAQLGLPAEAKGRAEGYLFPATYQFQPADTATDILATMVEHEQQAMNRLGISAQDQSRVLIEASLVQAEAGHPEDFGKIAQVLTNRLQRHWFLQLDTTVHYATGRFTLSTSLKDTQIKSPYNTYTNYGLPPGPICAPGLAAIQAVLEPTPGPWLYFVTTNPSTGLTEFAVTEAQFNTLKAKYDTWQAAHPGQ